MILHFSVGKMEMTNNQFQITTTHPEIEDVVSEGFSVKGASVLQF